MDLAIGAAKDVARGVADVNNDESSGEWSGLLEAEETESEEPSESDVECEVIWVTDEDSESALSDPRAEESEMSEEEEGEKSVYAGKTAVVGAHEKGDEGASDGEVDEDEEGGDADDEEEGDDGDEYIPGDDGSEDDYEAGGSRLRRLGAH